jgi:hypothetical protein
MFLPPGDAPSDAAGPNNDDATVKTRVRAEAGRAGIACQDEAVKGKPRCQHLRMIFAFADSRQCQTRNDAAIPKAEARLSQALIGRLTDRRQGLLQAVARVCRSCKAFPQYFAGEIGETGTTPGAAAVDAEQHQQRFGLMVSAHQQLTPRTQRG